MALIDKASLLMVPSTYEAGKLYNVLPSGNRAPDSTDQNSGYDQTRADFDFDRGSNAAATRIGSDGLLKKYRENELLQSNQFDTTWLNQLGGTITGGQSGYDGSSNAWLISKSASNFKSVRQVISYSGVTTLSVYAKAGTLTKAALRMDTSAGAVSIIYDLSLGVVSSSGGVFISRGIENVGNGWYRIFVSVNVSSGTNVHIYADRDGTTAGSIFIQNAQLESGLVATDVLTSGATTAKAGVLVDLPRINFDANGENGSLLLEPSRQNVVTNSEYVSSSDYVVGNWTGTITTNTTETLSPEGVYNATKFVKAGASDRVYFHNSQPDGAYTGSIYLKAASGSENKTIEISIRRFGGGGGSTTKLVTITNEWQRFDVSASNLTGGTTTAMYISDFSSAGTATDFYSYGMQIEAGSYPSSYIPNHSGTGGVTRAADSCSVTGASDVIGQTEGTLFYDVNISRVVGNEALGGINSGSYANHVTIQRIGNTFQFVRNSATQSGATIVTSATISAGRYKLAIAYKSGDTACFLNGTQVSTTQTQTFTNASLSVVRMSGDAIGALPISDSYKQATLFKERLSNAELATLTTL